MFFEEIKKITKLSDEEIKKNLEKIYSIENNTKYEKIIEKINLFELKIKEITEGLYEVNIPPKIIDNIYEKQMKRKLYLFDGDMIEIYYGNAYISRMQGTTYELFPTYFKKNWNISANKVKDFEKELISKLNLRKAEKEVKYLTISELIEIFNKKFKEQIQISQKEIQDFLEYYNKKLKKEDKIEKTAERIISKVFNLYSFPIKSEFIFINKNLDCELIKLIIDNKKNNNNNILNFDIFEE